MPVPWDLLIRSKNIIILISSSEYAGFAWEGIAVAGDFREQESRRLWRPLPHPTRGLLSQRFEFPLTPPSTHSAFSEAVPRLR